MFSKAKYIALVLLWAVVSCTPYRKMQQIMSGHTAISLSVPGDEDVADDCVADTMQIDSIKGTLSEGPVIMNAIRDDETGEMVATDVIAASVVTARFRNVAERAGMVSVSFDVTVPSGMSDSQWQLKIRPVMRMQEDTLELDPLFITGSGYRQAQMRGYQKYREFLSSIITDTTDFIRMGQLEIFLQRHFPRTYAMKNDSTLVTDDMEKNLFGVTQRDALYHYTMHGKIRRNERRKSMKEKMYRMYVKDPILTEGIRLDTVITMAQGSFVYRYIHTFKTRPGLRKVMVSLDGSIYEKGECILNLPFPEELTFYISSLSTLVDDTPKYRMQVLERRVYDNTKAFIDFDQGSSRVDTLIEGNHDELVRVRRCIEDVVGRREFALDSLVITASCSPEGPFSFNEKLSVARSEAVRTYLERYIPEQWRDSVRVASLPENWEQLLKLVRNDTVMRPEAVRRILEITADMTYPDNVECKMSRMPEYRYLREKVYPKLRSVSFEFYMHRVGMVKDTVHTTELDTVYAAGVEALKNLDYKAAHTLLRTYGDYNAALAMMSADYNHSALEVLDNLDEDNPKVCYLKAIVLSRLERMPEALKYFRLALAYDPSLEYRANLDPEMSELIREINMN